jgi:hypothetical protein
MSNIIRDELINELEAAYEEDQQAAGLKSQAKVITDGIKERLQGYAAEAEVAQKYVNEAYARFKKFKQKKLKASDEDFYAIIEAVDEYFMEDEEKEEE